MAARADSAPSSPRPPGHPSRPAVLSRPASWPGCDPYRPRRQGQARRTVELPRHGIELPHRLVAAIRAALIQALVRLAGTLSAPAPPGRAGIALDPARLAPGPTGLAPAIGIRG